MVFLEPKWRNLSAAECIAVVQALLKAKIKSRGTKLTEATWPLQEHARQRQKVEREVGTYLRSWSLGDKGVPGDVYDVLAVKSPAILEKFQLRREGTHPAHHRENSSAGKSSTKCNDLF